MIEIRQFCRIPVNGILKREGLVFCQALIVPYYKTNHTILDNTNGVEAWHTTPKCFNQFKLTLYKE